MKELLKKYINLGYTPTLEEQKQLDYAYVHFTNKLEGNKLTLVQTTELLSSDTISGTNIRTRDILEQKGMYKALMRMKKAVLDKEKLTQELIKELNGCILSSLWKDEYQYFDEKRTGQKLAQYKITQNVISISKGGKLLKRVEPKSNPGNVDKNMELIIGSVNRSNEEVIQKSVKLAQEIWIHQPFRDGNKRLGRLLINFLTMQEGYPLFLYQEINGRTYNDLLITEYIEEQPGILQNYVESSLTSKIIELIDKSNKIEKANKNFGLGLF